MSEAGHWRPAYVGLGSNLDGPARRVENAFALLDRIPESRLVSRSSLYRSAPFGGIEQPDFVNAVAALLTQLSAHDFLKELQRIEREQGRVRGETRWGPRVLDLDLLVYSDLTIADDVLNVPHPGIAERNFVLLPLIEIAPHLDIPGVGAASSIDVIADEASISRIA